MSNKDEEPPAKKLRFSEPDLQIVLGTDEDVSTIKVHSLLLANKSRYIDTMLSTPMREQETRTVSFPDISPGIWEKMNKFLDDPLAIRKMKIEDVLDVAQFYDKYEFTQGTKLCEDIMLDYLSPESLEEMENALTLNLNLVIDLTLIAHESNMSSVFQSCIVYLLRRLIIQPFPYRGKGSSPYTNIMFTEEQLKKIIAILGQSGYDNHLTRKFIIVLNESDQVNRSLQDVLNDPGVAKDFVHSRRQKVSDYFIMRCISRIEVSGTGRNADGGFKKTTDKEIGWAILRDEVDGEEDLKTCWWAPCSENLPVPPLAGWVPYDELATGHPTIKYILNESVG
eukprot:scaffold18149_cov48-Cyclotella_meneghiniana.AAC.6